MQLAAALVGLGSTAAQAAGAGAGVSVDRFRIAADRELLDVQYLPLRVEDTRCEPGESTRIVINLPSEQQLAAVDAEMGTFILIRKLPEGVTLSDGIRVDRNWVISLNQARSVKLSVPAQQETTFRLEYLLIGPGNRVLAETSNLVRIPQSDAPPQEAEADRTPVPEIEPGTTAAAPETEPRNPRGISLKEEALLLSRGTALIHEGSISAARLIFEELASRGSANGALALAQTFDPGYLRISSTSAIKPDVRKAVLWYGRAVELGSEQAKQRLEELKKEG